MKYKVGDKVKVKSDLKENTSYGGKIFVRDMAVYRGKNVEISKVHDDAYCIKESDREWFWTDKMFEGLAEDELAAEEAIKIQAEMCRCIMCKDCEIDKIRDDSHYECTEFRSKNPGKVLEILKQWKKDHEKKEVEVEFAWYAVIKDEKGSIVHEERIESPLGSNKEYLENNKEILAKYCSEHNGKFYELTERRCVVKEKL